MEKKLSDASRRHRLFLRLQLPLVLEGLFSDPKAFHFIVESPGMNTCDLCSFRHPSFGPSEYHLEVESFDLVDNFLSYLGESLVFP